MLTKPRFPRYVRAIAIVMLIAMFHYVAGYRLMYSLGLLYAKEEAKECMMEKKNGSQKLTLSAADYNSLKWTESGKEFSFNHQMYDVLNVTLSGSNYVIGVYPDDDETNWVVAFHDFEKEMFHPDQSTKGAKSAEDVMSAFQKDCTPVCEFNISIFSSTRLIQPAIADEQHPLQVPDTIWHPPAAC
jgi:hypothetical protein